MVASHRYSSPGSRCASHSNTTEAAPRGLQRGRGSVTILVPAWWKGQVTRHAKGGATSPARYATTPLTNTESALKGSSLQARGGAL